MDSLNSVQFTPREWNNQELNNLSTNPDYQYDPERPNSDGLLKKLWRDFWNRLMSTDGLDAKIPSYWYILISILVVGLTIWALATFSRWQKKPPQSSSSQILLENDIDQIDQDELNQALTEARLQKDFRLVIRYRFLMTLKSLSDLDLIHWKDYKTNQDYLSELDDQALKSTFSQLVYWYEYAWYGLHGIDEALLRKADSDFDHFGESLIPHTA